MSNLKVYDRVYVKELKKFGVVSSTYKGKAVTVRLDCGTVIEAVNLTVQIISLLKELWLKIKLLFSKK